MPANCRGAVNHLTLLRRSDRDHACLAALGPARLQFKMVAAVRIRWTELDGFLTPPPERPLEFEGHPNVRISNLVERFGGHGFRLGFFGDKSSVRDAVLRVRLCNDVLAVHFQRPLTQSRQAVLQRASGQSLAWLLPTASFARHSEILRQRRDGLQIFPRVITVLRSLMTRGTSGRKLISGVH